MRKVVLISIFAALSFAVTLPIAGCGKEEDGMSSEQQKKTDRLDDIAKKSNGDWDKVPQADRDYILKNITSGSEASAKMLLMGKAGKLHGGPPGSNPSGK